MARLWTTNEEVEKRKELYCWYTEKGKTIGEIGKILGIAEQTVFQRMQRFGMSSDSERKINHKRRTDIVISSKRTEQLAEFFGIMLGDGKLSPSQVIVTLGTKEIQYVNYVVNLIHKLFGACPKVGLRKNGFRDVYLGSVTLTSWLRDEGLVHNKVRSQVGVPRWITKMKDFAKGFLRGFFDTDGSVYRLRFGVQIAFTNRSLPLLVATQKILRMLGYSPSAISRDRVYLTRREDLLKFFEEIAPANHKHQIRFKEFIENKRR